MLDVYIDWYNNILVMTGVDWNFSYAHIKLSMQFLWLPTPDPVFHHFTIVFLLEQEAIFVLWITWLRDYYGGKGGSNDSSYRIVILYNCWYYVPLQIYFNGIIIVIILVPYIIEYLFSVYTHYFTRRCKYPELWIDGVSNRTVSSK